MFMDTAPLLQRVNNMWKVHFIFHFSYNYTETYRSCPSLQSHSSFPGHCLDAIISYVCQDMKQSGVRVTAGSGWGSLS